MKQTNVLIASIVMCLVSSFAFAQDHWIATNGMDTSTVCCCINTDYSGNLYASTSTGFYKYDSPSNAWNKLYPNYFGKFVFDASNNIYAVDIYKFYWSSDGGHTWNEIPKLNITQNIQRPLEIAVFPDGELFIFFTNFTNYHLYSAPKIGTNWTDHSWINPIGNLNYLWGIIACKNGYMIFNFSDNRRSYGTNDRLKYNYIDKLGTSINPLDYFYSSGDFKFVNSSTSAFPYSSRKIYSLNSSNQLELNFDCNLSPSYYNITGLIKFENKYIALSYQNTKLNHVLISNDNGNTFVNFESGLPSSFTVLYDDNIFYDMSHLIIDKDNYVYLRTDRKGVFRTRLPISSIDVPVELSNFKAE